MEINEKARPYVEAALERKAKEEEEELLKINEAKRKDKQMNDEKEFWDNKTRERRKQ